MTQDRDRRDVAISQSIWKSPEGGTGKEDSPRRPLEGVWPRQRFSMAVPRLTSGPQTLPHRHPVSPSICFLTVKPERFS